MKGVLSTLNIVILIPSLNPDDALLQLVQSLREQNMNSIVIINDGSNASCLEIFNKLEKDYCCKVISHEKNEGKGTALKTGIATLKEVYPNAVGFVTADADGQHSPDDILHIAEVLNDNPSSVILGVRDFNRKNVPFKSRYGNKITSAVFFLVTGRRCTDTQTGLRGIPIQLADELLNIDGKRFEYETNMLIKLAKEKIDFIEVAIDTIYTNNNRETHFRPVKDSFLIYAQIIKFVLSSLSSFVVDLFLFTVFHKTIFSSFAGKIIYSTITARVFSGIFNYNINKRTVFGSKDKSIKPFLKYTALFLIQMLLSSLFVHLLAEAKDINVTLIKMIVDTALFVLSFIIQKIFVFKI